MEEAVKHDQGKVRLSLLPLGPLTEVMEVFEYGAKKYSDWNYLRGEGLEPNRPLDACFRHLVSHLKGNAQDEESGKSHLAHAVCSLLMAMAIIEKRANHDKA